MTASYEWANRRRRALAEEPKPIMDRIPVHVYVCGCSAGNEPVNGDLGFRTCPEFKRIAALIEEDYQTIGQLKRTHRPLKELRAAYAIRAAHDKEMAAHYDGPEWLRQAKEDRRTGKSSHGGDAVMLEDGGWI